MCSYERAEEYTTIYIIVCLLIVFNPTTSIKPVLYYYLDLSTSDDQSRLSRHREGSGPTQRWCDVSGTWLWEGQATRETNVSTLTIVGK